MAKFKYLGGLLLLLGAPGSQAQVNFLANAAFDADLSSWETLFMRPVVWDSRDEMDNPASGSVLLTHDQPGNNGTLIMLAQCVAIQPDTFYQFGASIMTPSGQDDAFAFARVFAETYSSNDCSGGSLSSSGDDEFALPADVWQLIDGEITSEPSARSASVRLGLSKSAGIMSDNVALFDNVFLLGDDTLFSDGFE